MPALLEPLRQASIRGAGAVTAAALGALSRARGGRSVHPNGIAFHAVLEVDPEPPGFRTARLLRARRERRAIIRVSRALGLPEGLPDVLGAAVRVPDAYGPGHDQDLLLVTGGENALARHVLTPAYGYVGRTLSTLIPYRIGGALWVFLLRAEPDPRIDGRLARLADVVRAARAGALAFELSLAPAGGGRPVRVGRVRVGEPLSAQEEHELRFNPVHTGGGLEPATWLSSLRPDSYRSSQAARELERPRSSGAERRATQA